MRLSGEHAVKMGFKRMENKEMGSKKKPDDAAEGGMNKKVILKVNVIVNSRTKSKYKTL